MVFGMGLMYRPDVVANRCERFGFVGHWFFNIVGFGARALPTPIAGLCH
jgi:hypothetical protein